MNNKYCKHVYKGAVNHKVDFTLMNQDEVREYEIDVLKRISNLALITPKLNTDPLPLYDYDQLDYGMNAGITRTPGGRIYAMWIAGEDGPKAFMVIATSDDDGETWSKPCLVIDNHSKNLPMDRSHLVGNMWTDPLGRLWVFFDQAIMGHGRAGLWIAICNNPDADHPEWSVPKRIWHGSMLNKPTVLSTGEWLLPIEFLQYETSKKQFEDIFKELDPYRGANVFGTIDQGKTFQRLGCVKFPNPSWHEHMLVELKNGIIWMLARTMTGIMESFSEDKGVHWTEPSIPKSIRSIVARFYISRLTSGRILLVKHGNTVDETTSAREKLKAFLSEDDGVTWIGGLMLDEREGVSYPDGFQAPDGTIYISYDYKRSSHGHILMARFKEEDILAGEIVSPITKLNILISQPLKKRTAKIS